MASAVELQELQALERDLTTAGEAADYAARVHFLRLVRRLGLRRSPLVAQHGTALLNSPSDRRRLGEELWDILEQVAVASMDINALDVAKECIGALMLKFKKSARVGRLEGMWLEAKGWWAQADRVYSTLLQDYPQNQGLLKRQVAALRGQGKLLEASETLRKYLETYHADVDAWRELADLYLAQNMLRQAAFCQEELLLFNPANPSYHLQYAEMLYTLGGLENLKTSRAYYAAAIELSAGESPRALWGLCMVESALRQSGSKGAKSSSTELALLASETLSQRYKHQNPEKAKVVEAVLARLLSV